MKIACCLALLAVAALSASAAETISFSREVRPILSQHCFKCHGTDKQKSNLRLDDRASATKPAESGEIAIVPGQPSASELLRRVTSHDQDEVMPPPKGGKPLTAEQIDTLCRWIAAGAEYEAHWAYVKPVRPAVSGSGDPINALIAVRLDQAGLRQPPEADPPDADPPRHARSHRPAADARGSGCIRERQHARGLREGRGPSARIAALWREVGASLARPPALRRQRGLSA